MEVAAVSVLKRAVEMDEREQYTLALVLYQEGVQILLDAVKGTAHTAPLQTHEPFASSLSLYRLALLCDSLMAEFKIR